MNERIKEFRFMAAEFTNEQKPVGISKWNEIRDDKFAELIVLECASLVVDDDNAYDMLKHFGVEL